MPPSDATLLSTLPARALLGRLVVVRLALSAGWAAGIAWLHWGLGIVMPLGPMASVLAALLIGFIHQRSGQREDTAIGIVWAVGMAAGLLFIARTSGYVDPMSYLFGNILLVSRADVWRVAALDGLVVLMAVVF